MSGGTLAEIQAILRPFDDDAFVALVNRGLLRRARKDLERGQPVIESEDAECLVLRVEGQRVTLDRRGPKEARCDCAAAGLCQHILAACLALQSWEPAAADGTTDAPPEPQGIAALHAELMGLSDREIEVWAGKAAFREAVQLALDKAEAGQIEISGGQYIQIRFRAPDQALRYLGGGLDGVIADQGGPRLKRNVAAAVLAYRQAQGLPLPTPAGAARATSASGADQAAARLKVLEASLGLCRECVEIGLSHLSEAMAERLTTLSVSAEGAGLYRLARMLRGLADQVASLLAREAAADEERLLGDLATAYALAWALRGAVRDGTSVPIALTGQARSRFDALGSLDLVALGAYPWRSVSGFLGLTLLFWSPSLGEWLSYSDVRPEIQSGFDPRARYQAPGPWSGAASPARLMGRRLVLQGALASPDRRLSASEKSSVRVLGELEPSSLGPVIRDWGSLESVRTATLGRLHQTNPLDDLHLIAPAEYGRAQFDPVAQALRWPLQDGTGDVLELAVPYSAFTASAVQRLEALEPDDCRQIAAILIRRRPLAGTQGWEPVSLIRSEPGLRLVVLAFDTDSQTQAASAPREDRSPTMDAPSLARGIDRLLAPLGGRLLALAQRGTGQGLKDASSLDPLHAELLRCELAGIEALTALWRSASQAPPDLLLRLAYALDAVGGQEAASAEPGAPPR